MGCGSSAPESLDPLPPPLPPEKCLRQDEERKIEHKIGDAKKPTVVKAETMEMSCDSSSYDSEKVHDEALSSESSAFSPVSEGTPRQKESFDIEEKAEHHQETEETIAAEECITSNISKEDETRAAEEEKRRKEQEAMAEKAREMREKAAKMKAERESREKLEKEQSLRWKEDAMKAAEEAARQKEEALNNERRALEEKQDSIRQLEAEEEARKEREVLKRQYEEEAARQEELNRSKRLSFRRLSFRGN